MFRQPAQAALLMEEGFNYPVGAGLASNPPWSGSIGTSVGVVSGNLSLTNLQTTSPPGSLLQISGGASRRVYRNFSSNAVSGGAVYFSMLIQCAVLPTNSQFIASLMSAGNTSPNQPDDPLDLYVTTATNGYTFRLGHTGDDPVSLRRTLATNTTHFIVLKYTFGSGGQVGIFLDPLPGGTEPPTPDARTEDEGTDAANLQILLFNSSSSTAQGIFQFDTIRIATNWPDATPMRVPLSLQGPQDQAVCFGSSATFTVLAGGTPPFAYLWRTNGIAVGGGTNTFFTLSSPGANDAANRFDVVVNDAFGSVTSRLAKLVFSTNAPAIVTQPASQLIQPGVSNATFSLTAAGDAPLTYQWRMNGLLVSNATNASYTITGTNVSVENLFDVVISNPCGSVTSSPPAGVYFPNSFHAASDAGAGFFGGENLIFTNVSGMVISVWSSPDLIESVTNWNFEGAMSELPLGATGYSRYGINLNPVTSPVYYIFATTNVGPYTPTEPVSWLTTLDFSSFTVTTSNLTITADGFLDQNSFYAASDAGAGFFGGENLIFTNASEMVISVWSSPDLSISVTNWTLEGTMSELPLGSSGYSRYGINLNPVTSPVYYVFSQYNIGPYTPAEALIWLTTSDFSSFGVEGTNWPIGPDGVFIMPSSSPPQNSFLAAYDAGPGISGSEVLTFTNGSGTNFYVWSSHDPSLSVANWTLEGAMSELPLGTGNSLYAINLNPRTSPAYFIFAQTNTGPYNPVEALVWLSTADFSSFSVAETNVAIDASGVFALPALPSVTQLPVNQTVLAGQNTSFIVTALGGGLSYQWSYKTIPIPGAVTPFLNLTNLPITSGGNYIATITNSLAAISCVASLIVVAPPALTLGLNAPATLNLNVNTITGLTCVVQVATNLVHPNWISVATNITGNTGSVSFQPNPVASQSLFYRLVFP